MGVPGFFTREQIWPYHHTCCKQTTYGAGTWTGWAESMWLAEGRLRAPVTLGGDLIAVTVAASGRFFGWG
jgi:hypothetical protein